MKRGEAQTRTSRRANGIMLTKGLPTHQHLAFSLLLRHCTIRQQYMNLSSDPLSSLASSSIRSYQANLQCEPRQRSLYLDDRLCKTGHAGKLQR